MTSYPTGVAQNMAPPHCPLDLQPVPESSWRMFSTQAEADQGLGMIDSLCTKVTMVDAETLGGIYSQYIYSRIANLATIHCRVVNAEASDADGRMEISEYPSDILDRDTTPNPMVDRYTVGQSHVLKVQRLTPSQGALAGLGQLYWDAV